MQRNGAILPFRWKLKFEMGRFRRKQVFVGNEGPTEKQDAASLLLSVAAIASKEIRVDGLAWNDEEQPSLVRPKAPFGNSEQEADLALRFVDHPRDDDMEDLKLPPTDDRFSWSRIRAVSMDTPKMMALVHLQILIERDSLNIISPESSPVSRRMPRTQARTSSCQAQPE